MTDMDLTRDPDGRELSWPPQYVDLHNGTLRDWDATVVPAEGEQPEDEPITYRRLAWEICDAYGGIDDLLGRMWLHFGGAPDEPEPATPARAGEMMCDLCGQRPGQIDSDTDGWACWPCYEDLPDG